MIEALLERPMPTPTTSEPRPATIGELSPLRTRKTSEPNGMSTPPTRSMARTPKRLRPTRTPTVAPIGHPSTIAESAKPPMSGDCCITPCTNTGRNVVSPIITMPARSDAPLAAAIGRRPQSSSEIIGSGDRRSCRTNSTTATTATRVVSPISSRPEVESAVRSAMMAAMATVNMPASDDQFCRGRGRSFRAKRPRTLPPRARRSADSSRRSRPRKHTG